jgi:hypothetical protein
MDVARLFLPVDAVLLMECDFYAKPRNDLLKVRQQAILSDKYRAIRLCRDGIVGAARSRKKASGSWRDFAVSDYSCLSMPHHQ